MRSKNNLRLTLLSSVIAACILIFLSSPLKSLEATPQNQGQNQNTPPPNLPTFIAKQDITNLRFIDRDGLYTYYQNRQGDLFLSTNYKVQTLFKGSLGDNYTLLASTARKKIVVSIENHHRNNNQWHHLHHLKLIDFGGHSVVADLEQGIAPKLHLQDTWISSFRPQTKTLIFWPTNKMNSKFSFFLENQDELYQHPFFIPQVVMVSEHDILYTDISNEGHSVVMLFNRRNHSKTLLLKQKTRGVKIELCLQKSLLYIGQFGLSDISFGSQIEVLNLEQTKDFSKMTLLYKSNKSDYGHLSCEGEEGKIYFVKNLSPAPGPFITKTELVALQTNSVQVLSDLNYVTQFIEMDGRILIPFQGKLYVAVGENNLIEKEDLSKGKGVSNAEAEAETESGPAPEPKLEPGPGPEIESPTDTEADLNF